MVKERVFSVLWQSLHGACVAEIWLIVLLRFEACALLADCPLLDDIVAVFACLFVFEEMRSVK